MSEFLNVAQNELTQLQNELEQARQKVKMLEAKLAGKPAQPAFHAGFSPLSEQFFQKVIESSHDHIVLLDENAKVVYSNNVKHILGYTIEEYVALEIPNLLYWEDADIAQKYWQAVIANPNSVQSTIVRARHKQGHLVWVEINSVNMLEDPEIGLIISNTRDISDRKNAEEALQKSELLFRNTFEQVAVGIAHNALDGRWLRVNKRLCEIVGYDIEELISKSFQDITYPDDINEDIALTQKVLQGDLQTFTIDKRYIHKNGKIVWVKLTVKLIRDAAGNPNHFVVVVEDITQLKETQQALFHSEKRYRQIVEAQEDLICRFRPDGQITFTNEHYAKVLFNKQPEELIGKNLLDLIPETVSQQLVAIKKKLDAENHSIRLETPYPRKGGARGWVDWNHRVILDDGKPIEYQVVGRDTTERRLMEDAEREQRKFAEALRDSLAALTASLDIDEVMQKILQYAVTVVPSDAASISLFEGDYGKIAYVLGISKEEENLIKLHTFSIQNALFKHIQTTRQPYLVKDTREDENWVTLEANRWIRSTVGIPIIVRNELIGTLHVDSKDPKHFSEEDAAKLQDFARYASLALEHAYHIDKLEERVSERTIELEAYAAEIHDLYNNAPCGYHSLDANGYFVSMNDTELQWLGYRREEVIGKLKYTDITTAASLKTFGNNFAQLKKSGFINNIESSLVRKDGTIIYVLLSSSSIKDENGQFLRSRSTVYDITALKQAQETVRQQRDLLQSIIDATPTLILLKGEDGRYEMVNERAAKIYGLTSAEMLGKNDAEVHENSDEVAVFAEQDRYVRTTGKSLFLPDNSFGEYHYQTSVIPLKNVDNEVKRILIVSNDITQRKKIEQALSEQRDFLHSIINNVPNLIMVKDRFGRFEMVNERVAQIYNLSASQMIGKTDAEINYNKQEVAYYRAKDQQALESGECIFIADELILERHYQTNKIPLKNSNGEYDRLLVVASDITEHKKAETLLQQALQKEKELSELRSRFLSMTSHEFRTPLTAILATAETLSTYRNKLTDEQIGKRLLKIQEQVIYLRTIMEDVLQLSKLQANRAELSLDVFDLDLLCQQIIDELRSEFTIPHQIDYRCEGNVKAICLDKKLMRQIINNLLSNAIKYSPNGTPIALLLSQVGQLLTVHVIDQGIGIPEEDQKHLFEMFHRASNVGNITGTGLGLTIAKESVDLQGGTMTVKSHLGVGTTFSIQIPLEK